jgi:hypothetical protein
MERTVCVSAVAVLGAPTFRSDQLEEEKRVDAFLEKQDYYSGVPVSLQGSIYDKMKTKAGHAHQVHMF